MLTLRVYQVLNQQIRYEAESSQLYLAMASWAESNGFEGVAQYMFAQSDEERLHMLKFVKYINERGEHAILTELSTPQTEFNSLKELFQLFLEHEIKVSGLVNNIVAICLEEKDFATHNFIQWFVAEQIEEEASAKNILDKVKLIGDDNSGFYLLDKDIKAMIPTKTTPN